MTIKKRASIIRIIHTIHNPESVHLKSVSVMIKVNVSQLHDDNDKNLHYKIY